MKRKGQIVRIKNGKYVIRVQRRSEDGERKSISVTVAGTRETAVEELKKLIAKIEKAEKEPKREPKTCAELFDAYLEVVKPTVREQTYYLYVRLFDSYLREKFGKISIHKITPYDVEKHYAEMQKTLSAVTIQKVHTQFKAAMRKARLWKWIEFNPCADVKPPKIEKKRKDILTLAEIRSFIEACPDRRTKTMWTFFALTGARASEIFAARWADIKDGVWHVSQSLVQIKQVKKFDSLKTVASRREVPLESGLVELLRAHKNEQNIHRLKTSAWIDNDLVFPTSTGKPQRLSNLGEKCTKIRIKAGIDKNVTPHLFRHSFISHAVKTSADVKAVSEIAGHANTSITLDVYTHTGAEDKRSVTRDVDQLFKIA